MFSRNSTTYYPGRNRTDQTIPLPEGCILDKFIRVQMGIRGIVDVGFPLTKLQIVESLTIEDEFEPMYFDYMRGMFDMWLVPVDGKTFPLQWYVPKDAEILYKIAPMGIITDGGDNNNTAAGHIDRPSTVSLERFIAGICEKENNGSKNDWLEKLRKEDIRSYTHLANLKYEEWEQMKSLSANARKIIKSYVDREKQLAAEIKKTTDSKDESDEGKYE